MRMILTNKSYRMNIYSDRGSGFYPITFIVTLFSIISTALYISITTLFTIVMLGMVALPISIYMILKNVSNVGDIIMDCTSLNIIEDEQVSIMISFEHGLFRLLKMKKLITISDSGIRILKAESKRNKEEFLIKILIQGYCGKHQIKGFVIFFSDPFIYINYRIEIILTKPLLIHIIPRSTHIEMDIESDIPYISYEAHLSKRKGIGVNILGIREYLPGDDYRRIDWKATARTSKLMVKEFEKHLCKDVLFIASIHDGFFSGEPPTITYLLRIVLNLLTRIANSGLNLGIGIATEREVIISNKVTKYNLKHIYEVLSSITWPLTIDRKSYSSANRILRWFINELANKICSESCLVIIFMDIIDDLDIENVKKILKELTIRHYALKVFLIQPLTIRFILSSLEFDEFGDLQIERNMYKHIIKYFKGTDIVSSVADLL